MIILKKRYGVLFINILIFLIIIINVFQNQILFNMKTKSKIIKKKYILYECSGKHLCGGLVDRFKGIINAYAWSLFTKRDLIVKMTKPCQFVNLMLPSRINWNIKLEDLVKQGYLKEDYSIYKISKIDNPGYRNDLANMDIINYHNESDIIIIFSNLEWISSYIKNK